MLQEAVQRDGTASPRGGAVSNSLRRARWHRQIGYACLGLGRVEEGRHNLKQSVALLGYPVPRSRWRFALGLLRQGIIQVLHRILPGRVERQRATEGSPLLEGASADCGLVSLYYFASQPWRMVYASLRALNLCERAGLSPELARSYATVEVAATLIPWHSVAAAYGRRALHTARAVGDRSALAWVLLCHACYSTLAGNWEEVRNGIEEGIEVADSVGDRQRGVELTIVLSCVLQYQGDFQASIKLARDCHARASRTGDVQGQVLALLREVENLMPLGQPGQALALLDRAAPLLAHQLGVSLDFWAAGMRAVVHLRRGEARLAQTVAEAAGKLVAGLRPTFWGALEGYAGVAEVCLSLWEAADATTAEPRPLKKAAVRACAALWKYARVFQIYRPRAWCCQGRAAWLCGRPARAHRAWRRSLDAADRLRMPLERGLALYEIGRHLPAADPSRQAHL